MGRLGHLDQSGDRWQLRFTRRLPHPPQKVWRALTEPEHLRAWFPQEVEGRWEVGARLRFVDGDFAFHGELLTFEPPTLLEYQWGEDLLRFELQPDGDGTVLTLVDTFDDRGKAARDAAGWHACLDVLECALAGQEPGFDPGARWGEVHPRYVEELGPEAATIGPPEGFSPER